MKIKLKKLILQNFMNYHEMSIDFAEITKIIGKNGKGKSSILTGYTWLLFNCDYELKDNPKVRREIEGVPVSDMDVSVEGIFELDGKEVSVKKVQKRKFGKDGVSYADNNTYFINEVPKTLRDFNDYFDLDMDVFKMCSSINAFLSKKPKEMREFLFGTVDSVTDFDVSEKFEDLAELVPLLQQYELGEIVAMNKASKAKISKELPILEGQIKEKERDCTVDIDTAELELQANAIKEQIVKLEAQTNDTDAQYEQWQRQSDQILQKKMDLNEYVRKANAGLVEQKSRLNRELLELQQNLRDVQNDFRMAELDKQRCEQNLERHNKERDSVFAQWKEWNAKQFDESIWVIGENDTICKMCGQRLPEVEIEERRTHLEERRQDALEKFNDEKASHLENLNGKGKEITNLMKNASADIDVASDKMEELALQSGSIKKEISDKENELAILHPEVDLSDNQEFQAMQAEVIAMEEAHNSMTSGTDIRNLLKIKLSDLREELSAVERQIASADTTEAEERLEELRKNRMDMEQAKADCEKILFLVDKLDKHKNEMLADSINAQFKYVDWKLWETNKSDNYKSVCIPTIDKKSLLDISSNKGNRIIGKLDICNSIQKITGINCPVFLDDAESLDSDNMNKCLEMMHCQVVTLMVSDDAELRVEVA
ncbi:hypothetical protein RO787_22820 [Blautia coccoides]|uniref:AAA family ATPase n=1 Tax=Blautia producta TaxID=33035 RepID=UPI0028A48EB9|nr:AAA family ATPase [Blautia coccoides]MDT4376166.1 hypothetical protein [Blautia coccoides]